MPYNPKRTVAKGHDEIALVYLEHFGLSEVRDNRLDLFVKALPEGDAKSVLDLGCGAGIPVASRLSRLGHKVFGIDGSIKQIELARSNVPQAEFIHGDMTEVDLPSGSFDGICAFYSISHVPASEQGGLIRRIAHALKPGGVFLGSFGVDSLAGDWRGSWLGTEMFFSHSDRETTLSMFDRAGLGVELAEEMVQDNEDAAFLWIMARKL